MGNNRNPGPETAVSLGELDFVNRFTRQLPADPEPGNHRRQVHAACYSRVLPTPAPRPVLLAVSREMMEELGIRGDPFADGEFAEVFAGNRILPGMDPFAMCYGGHQFGNWAGQLGDGRAINLGEVRTRQGQHWTLQLKGAGPTPYSRTADGLAVLRSSVREFLCSEAMHHLGIPTTRALSLVATGLPVIRDMFYDGNPQSEAGAVVCRVASSFVRFGNFEIFAARRDHATLARLVEFTIRSDFGGIDGAAGIPDWFAEVCRRTICLVVHWMRVGFVHGVMNTDNMSITGLTIDYGPYGWLEDYDPGWTPNTTDAAGRRYCYGAQPQIALWNLVQLANALVPLVGEPGPLQAVLDSCSGELAREWNIMMAAKTGLPVDGPDSGPLVTELLEILPAVETDMTLFFRGLGAVRCEPAGGEVQEPETVPSPAGLPGWLRPLEDAFYRPEQLAGEKRQRLLGWLERWREKVRQSAVPDGRRREWMNRVNPRYVLRNYLAQQAIDRAGEGDCSGIQELLEVLRHPYDDLPGREAFAAKRPEWARHRAGCSMLSCSS